MVTDNSKKEKFKSITHNSSLFYNARGEFVNAISKKNEIISKLDLIITICRDKNVLDIGCINHSWRRAIKLGDEWPHKRIKNVASHLTGLDNLSDDIRELRKYGYEIIEGNAEEFELNRTFDVIVCGDVIEHLSNVGLFLNCLSRHMSQTSTCLITTPNPFNIEQAFLAIFENRISVNKQHTAWFDPRVLFELVSRTDLRIADFYWIDTAFHFPVARKGWSLIANKLARIIMKKRPICNRDFAVILKKMEQ